MFLSVDRFDDTAGQYRNVFTAIRFRRQRILWDSSTSEERFIFLRISSRQRNNDDRDLASPFLIAKIDLNYGRAFFSRSWSLVSRTWSISRMARRRADEEEKDCPRGAWIELLTIGLLCRGAFQPGSGRFKASVDSRRRGIAAIYIYTYTHRNIIILPGARYLKERERERALAPMRDQSYLAEKGIYPSMVGAETIQRLFIASRTRTLLLARCRKCWQKTTTRQSHEFVARVSRWKSQDSNAT